MRRMPELISVKNNGNRQRTVFVFASLAIALVAAVLCLGSFKVREFEQTVISDTQKHLLTIARTQAEHIEELICETQCDLEALAANPIIKNRIRNNVRGSEIAEGDYRPFQHMFLEERHIAAALYRIDSTGIVQARVPPAEGREGRDYSNKPGVKFVLENHTKRGEHSEESYEHVSELLTTASGAYAIAVCVPVFEKEEFIGVLRALIYADQLGDIIGGIEAGEKGYGWLIDDDGQVLSHPDAEQIGADFMTIRREKLPGADWSELEDVTARMRDGEEGVALYHSAWWAEPNPRMVKKIVAFAPIEIGNEQWSIAVTMGYDEIAGPITRYARNTLILGGLLILIFLAGGTALYRVQKKKDELEIIAASATELESANRKLQTEITERKQAEEALRESEGKYRTLVENLPQKIFFKDRNLVYVSCNEQYARDLGLAPDEIAGHTDYDFYSRELAEKYRADDARIMQSEETEDMEEDYIQDDQELIVHTVKTPVRDEGGKVVGILGIFWDITERKRADEAQQESEERFRTIFDKARDGMLLADPETKRFYTGNEMICRMLGYTLEELKNLGVMDIHRQEDLPYAMGQFEKLSSREIEVAKDIPVKRKDGTVFYADISAGRVTLGDGTYMLGIFRDITERKQAEEALQEAYQRNETVLQTSMDGFMIMQPDGSIIECNEAFCEVAGYSQDELLDMNIGALAAQMTAEDLGETMQQVMDAGSRRFETAMRRKDGTIVDLEVATTSVELSEDSFIVSFTRDITETKRLWDELNHQLVRDALTGVYNRRYFNETIIQEIGRADRYGHHVSFIMGDIDGLKAINDGYGHLVGDQILQGVAEVLQKSVRAADVIIRYGGDEFLVVMPETRTEQAHAALVRFQDGFSEELAQRVQDGALSPDLPADLGFSMGVACYEPDTDVAVEEVLAQADAAMYQVKQAKRAKRATA